MEKFHDFNWTSDSVMGSSTLQLFHDVVARWWNIHIYIAGVLYLHISSDRIYRIFLSAACYGRSSAQICYEKRISADFFWGIPFCSYDPLYYGAANLELPSSYMDSTSFSDYRTCCDSDDLWSSVP